MDVSNDELVALLGALSNAKAPSGFEDEALAVARETLGDVEPSALKAMGRAERDRLLQLMRDAGLTIRQVERLTGIGRSTISHATHRRRNA